MSSAADAAGLRCSVGSQVAVFTPFDGERKSCTLNFGECDPFGAKRSLEVFNLALPHFSRILYPGLHEYYPQSLQFEHTQ